MQTAVPLRRAAPRRHRTSRRRRLALAAALVLWGTASPPAAAAAGYGVRLGRYTGYEDVFVGAELVGALTSRVDLDPNAEWVFRSNATAFTLNADLAYRVNRLGGGGAVWVGGGPGLGFVDAQGRRARAGLVVNGLVGLGLPLPRVVPYVQGKVVLGRVDDVVFTVGIRF